MCVCVDWQGQQRYVLFGEYECVFQAGVGTSRSRSRLVEARTFYMLQPVALAALGLHQRRMVPPALEDPMIVLEPHAPEAERSRSHSQRERRSGSYCTFGRVVIPFGEVAPPGFIDAGIVPML